MSNVLPRYRISITPASTPAPMAPIATKWPRLRKSVPAAPFEELEPEVPVVDDNGVAMGVAGL